MDYFEKQYITNCIEEICSNIIEQSDDISDLIQGVGIGRKLKKKKNPNFEHLREGIIESFKKLQSEIELELDTFLQNTSDDDFGKLNQYRLLSLMSETSTVKLFSKIKRKNSQNTGEIKSASNSSLMQMIGGNHKNDDNSEQKRNIRKEHDYKIAIQKLEMEFIEVVSIIPDGNKAIMKEKYYVDASQQVEIFSQESDQQIESVSAQSPSLVHQSKNNSTNSSLLATPSKTTSNISTGQIDRESATLLFAKHGSHISLYDINSEGAIIKMKHAKELRSTGVKILPQAANSDQIKYYEDVNKTPQKESFEIKSQQYIAKVLPRGNSIVAREISFQSSFDTAALLQDTTELNGINITDDENINGQKWNTASSVPEEESVGDEETLNLITPIPTTLEFT